MLLSSLIKLENILLGSLLVGGVISLYSGNIYLLLVSEILLFVYYQKKADNIIEKCLYFLIVFLPFYSWIRVSLNYMGLSFLAPVFNNIRDSIILIMFFWTFFNDSMKIEKKDYIWFFFMAIWSYAFVLTVIYGYPLLGLQGLHLSVLPALLYLAVRYSHYEINIYAFKQIFTKISVVIAIIGLISYIIKPPFFQIIFALSGNIADVKYYIRLVSVFLTPNVCGAFFSVAFCVAIDNYINKNKIENLISAFLFAACIVLTLSRGSWIFLASTIIIYLFYMNLKQVVVVVCFITLFYAVISFVGDSFLGQEVSMLEYIQKRYESLLNTNNSNSYGRFSSWFFLKELMSENPFGLGIGVGTTALISNTAETQAYVIDGFFVKTLIESGFAGLLYCIGLVGWSYNKIKYFYIKGNQKKVFLPLTICTGFFLQSIGSNTLDFVCVAPWFWLFLALSSKEIK